VRCQIYNFQKQLVEVEYFQLCQWIACINLEAQGLKHSRGSVTQHVRNLLGTSPRFNRQKLLDHLEKSRDNIKEQLDEAQQTEQ